MGQSGAYAAYVIDRAVRSAGSGFTQSWDLGIFGCKLSVARGGTAILPRTTAFPAPFAGFLGGATGSANLRVAPLLIGEQRVDGRLRRDRRDGRQRCGRRRAAGHPLERRVRQQPSARQHHRPGSNDLALVSQGASADAHARLPARTGGSDRRAPTMKCCRWPAPTTSPPAAPWRPWPPARAPTSRRWATRPSADNVLQFQLLGVGANRTLFSYDLLSSDGGADAQPLVEGVVHMHALYGMVNTDRRVRRWETPTGGYDIATIMTSRRCTQIVAVRIALVLRSSNSREGRPAERGARQALTSSTTCRRPAQRPCLSTGRPALPLPRRRFTIPLRNVLLLPTS